MEGWIVAIVVLGVLLLVTLAIAIAALILSRRLEPEVAALTASITLLNSTVDAQGKTLATINTTVTGLSSTVTGLSSTVSGLNTALTTVTNTVGNLTTEVNGLTQIISESDGRIELHSGGPSNDSVVDDALIYHSYASDITATNILTTPGTIVLAGPDFNNNSNFYIYWLGSDGKKYRSNITGAVYAS